MSLPMDSSFFVVQQDANKSDDKYDRYVKKILKKEKKLIDNNKFPEFVVSGNNLKPLPSIKVGDKVISHRSWMENIDGENKLHRINIPGSHDSLAYGMSDFNKKYSQCQNNNVREQLESGIRIFDVRLFFDKKTCNIYCCHGKGPLKCNCHKKYSEELVSYDFVLSTIICFLKENPSETVIVAPKHKSGDKKLTIFCINLRHERLKNMGVVYVDDKVPTLDEVRGKIVIWDKKGNLDCGMKIITKPGVGFSINEKYAGVVWKKIQKKFQAGPQEKIDILKNSLEEAENIYNNSNDKDYGFINYTSGFATELGIFPNATKVAEKVNPFIKNYKLQPGCVYGWFNGDFVDADYAQKIFLSNFPQNSINS